MACATVRVREFIAASADFKRRLPIATDIVRAEVYAAAMLVPDSIRANRFGRYQPSEIALDPGTAAARPLPISDSVGTKPMPKLLPD